MLVHQHCCLPGYFVVLWTVAMMILCALTPEQAYSLKITSDHYHYYGTRDRSVSLNCEFTLDSEDLEHLDIQWNIVPPNKHEDDKLILWYTQSIIHNNLYAPLKNRNYFTSPEPQDGDASLSITDLKLTDSGTYQCKVRYQAREQTKDILLTVMERPDKPVCYMDDEAVLGTNIRLKCKSSQGTPPLKYRWAKFTVNRMLDPDAFVDAPEGDLCLDQITERDSGTYLCTVQNLVGMEDCELILKITSPSIVIDRRGPIAGTTAGITAGVCLEDCEPVLNITSPSTVIDRCGPIAGTTAGITAGVCLEDCEPVLNITSPSTVIDRCGPIEGTTAGITAEVGLEDYEPVLIITSPSTGIDGPIAGTTAGITAEVGLEDYEPVLIITSPSTGIDGPIAGTTADITSGVGMEDCEPVLNITSPSTVIDGHGPIAGIIAGAIVAVIVVITVALTPVIYYCRRKRHGRLRRNLWAHTNSCNYWPTSLEQLRCEEGDDPDEKTETTNPVLSSSAEVNEKNASIASIEEVLTACVEAEAKTEKSEDNGSMGNRDEVGVEGQEPCSLHIENEKNASHEQVMTAL